MKTGNISKNNDGAKCDSVKLSSIDTLHQLRDTIHYFQSLIQKTILSLQRYKQLDIIGANELNLATKTLETLYIETTNNLLLLKTKTNSSKVGSNIDIIRNDISSIFKQIGTTNIHDLLNVVYGDGYLNTVCWNTDKYKLIEQYFHPISFKLINWVSDKPLNKTEMYDENVVLAINNPTHDITTIEKNKIVEDSTIVEKSLNLDCFDLSRTSKNFQTKVYGLKIAIHNSQEKKTMIVSGLIDDLLTTCIDNDYLNNQLETLVISSVNHPDYEANTFQRYIQSLTLKEILVYSIDELLHKYQGYISQIKLIKQKPIEQVVKEFIGGDLYSQRTTLIQLLLKSDEHEYQYLAYLLYDLLSNENDNTIDSNDQTILFDSLPWRVKSFFKDAMKQTISYTNNLSNFDTNKIPLEQQICLMKTDDSIKEKAMNKLKEIKSKGDDSGTKARTYLDGLLKIPFGIYKNEPILQEMDTIKSLFKNVLTTIRKVDDNPIFNVNLKTITNIQIKNICEQIKNTYIQIVDDKVIGNIINSYTPDKRSELILNICTINNIIKTYKLNRHKLIHSGKKIEYMKQQITMFINEFKKNTQIIDELSKSKKITSLNTISNIIDDINIIESRWNTINTYMNNVTDVLTDAVHGHDKAKRQIQRIIAQWINGESKGYCFGFEGPPGCGKTTFAKKGLAKCLLDENNVPRPFSFIAIGGQDNGSSLNGHNYTYVGSEWGKFVDILIKNKCMNPIIFIDELDKVSKTENGKEIIGILTHLVDSTQNDCFQDKYFNGIELDLSKALFIFSYNDVSAIDRILLDRIHRIKFEHLTLEDKIVITNKHILPEIYKNMGLSECIHLTDDNIIYIIENYTNEPGIRKFKELLFEIVGEINLQCLTQSNSCELPIIISNDDIKYKYLKSYHENLNKKIPIQSAVGVINGLWANSMGQGGIIPIEAQYFPSTNFMELKLTGLQGDVMKESMTVAKTLACSLVSSNIMKNNLQLFEETKRQGIHIHCPEGAVPKDGPSAGTAITCAIYSLLTSRPIKKTIAITGEINLQGCVTAIGGLDLKILGGIKGGVKEFIFPKENSKDFQEFQTKYSNKNLIDDIKFHPVENIQQVLNLIFEP